MAGLLGDVWFYASGAGFLVSLGLFIFLLGQYRAAVEASEDEPASEEKPAEAAEPVEMVSASPVDEDKTVLLAPRAEPKPEPEPEPAAAAAVKATPVSTSESTLSSLSPAVAYLQGIKAQMENLDKEIASLRAVVAQQGAQGEAILKRLAEVSELAAKQSPAPAEAAKPVSEQTMPAPAAKPAPEQTQPALTVERFEAPKPAPAPTPTPAASDETVILPPMSQKPAEQSPAEEPRAARKGPVWPI